MDEHQVPQQAAFDPKKEPQDSVIQSEKALPQPLDVNPALAATYPTGGILGAKYAERIFPPALKTSWKIKKTFFVIARSFSKYKITL